MSQRKSVIGLLLRSIAIVAPMVTIIFELQGCSTSTSHFVKGELNEDLGRYREAIEEYTVTIEGMANLKEKDALAYHRRGNCYLKLGMYRAALSDFDQAIQSIELSDSYHRALYDKIRLAAKVYYHRAKTYEKLGKKVLAAKDEETAKGLGYKPE